MDQHAYDEWLSLWTDDALYWVPCNENDFDPEFAQTKANFYNFYNRLSAGSTAQPQPLRAVADHHQPKG
jgi:Ring hydroxylating beta subunit